MAFLIRWFCGCFYPLLKGCFSPLPTESRRAVSYPLHCVHDEGRSNKVDQCEAGDEKRTGEVLQSRVNTL